MTNHIKEFEDDWQSPMYRRIDELIEDSHPDHCMEGTSAAGYWKLMALAAWAESRYPDKFDELVVDEYYRCGLRDEADDNERTDYQFAQTADGVSVSNFDLVFWKHAPEMRFYPVSKSLAVPVDGGASEPMAEMYSTRELARSSKQRVP